MAINIALPPQGKLVGQDSCNEERCMCLFSSDGCSNMLFQSNGKKSYKKLFLHTILLHL